MFRFFQLKNSGSDNQPVFAGGSGNLYHISGRLRVFRFGFLLVALFMLFFSGILTTTVEGLGSQKEISSDVSADQLLSTRAVQKPLNSPDSAPESGN
jgi:hypothetical protein